MIIQDDNQKNLAIVEKNLKDKLGSDTVILPVPPTKKKPSSPERTKILRIISGSILTSYNALFYLEELARTKKPKHRLKNLLNQVIRELKVWETKEFDFIDMHDKDGHMSVASDECMVFMDAMLDDKANMLRNQLDFQRFYLAYASNPEGAMKGVEEVLEIKE